MQAVADGSIHLAKVRVALEICYKGFGFDALVIGRVAGVHLDAGIHDGHPLLLVGMQLSHQLLCSVYECSAIDSHTDLQTLTLAG